MIELTIPDPDMQLLRSARRMAAMCFCFGDVPYRLTGMNGDYTTPPWTVTLSLSRDDNKRMDGGGRHH